MADSQRPQSQEKKQQGRHVGEPDQGKPDHHNDQGRQANVVRCNLERITQPRRVLELLNPLTDRSRRAEQNRKPLETVESQRGLDQDLPLLRLGFPRLDCFTCFDPCRLGHSGISQPRSDRGHSFQQPDRRSKTRHRPTVSIIGNSCLTWEHLFQLRMDDGSKDALKTTRARIPLVLRTGSANNWLPGSGSPLGDPTFKPLVPFPPSQ